jgi:hypothetical protein
MAAADKDKILGERNGLLHRPPLCPSGPSGANSDRCGAIGVMLTARQSCLQMLYVYNTYSIINDMSKKLTITIDDEVYAGLHNVIGRGRISRFLNDLARPHVLLQELAEGYRAMAGDEERERDAAEWVDGVTGDIADDPR